MTTLALSVSEVSSLLTTLESSFTIAIVYNTAHSWTVELMAFELKAFRIGDAAPKYNVRSYDKKNLKMILRIS
jgi:hypothetical protein